MSRDAMLEEAIAKAKERKEWQLVEWLRSARGATASARYYTECIADLNAENAKLRELVRTFYHCAARGECDVCAMRDGRGLDEDTVCFAMHDRMRELGVEV